MLAHMAFGAGGPGAIVHHGLQPLAQQTAHEIWYTAAPEAAGRDGAITWRADPHIFFGSAAVPIATDTAGITYDLYREIFLCTRAHGFPHLLRVWHYLPRINEGAGDNERYKRFCLGRARAFDEWPSSPAQLPAGTAIGTRAGHELLIYFLATRIPARQIENPRQLSAFQYPRRYGPREPLFSRAVVWSQGSQAWLLVSGTASIVGHESTRRGDLEGQLRETWRNLECLRASAGATLALALRVYIRHATHYRRIREFIRTHLHADVPVLYLHAEICRSELLVEIEGVYAMPPDPESASEAASRAAGTRG